MKNNIWFWVIAIVITLGAAYYQKKTGPTYPAKTEYKLDGKNYYISLPRSHGGNSDCPIEIQITDTSYTGEVLYRHFPAMDAWISIDMKRDGQKLIGLLPNQPPAGKLQYFLVLKKADQKVEIGTQKPTIVRFKGDVPAYILIPHILFMFIAMLLSNLSGAMAIGNRPAYRKYTNYALFALFIGGMILGPIVQKFAFGELWTGIPFGFDLTDNKTLIAFVFFFLAVLGNLKKERKYLTILAAIILLIVYSVPHSLYGSTLNTATGKVVQGWILFTNLF
jgi:hypothetical protein